MAIFAFILIVLGLLGLLVGTVWFVINAFRVSVLWGIFVCIFSPAWIRFAWRHWDMAKAPFLTTIAALLLAIGGMEAMPADAPTAMAELAQSLSGCKLDRFTKKSAELPETSAGQKEMELKLKLATLAQKETDLRARKAAIDPKNREAAAALTEEINRYNAELQPVLQAQRESILSATH